MCADYIKEVKEFSSIAGKNAIEIITNLDSVKILFEFLSDDVLNIAFYKNKVDKGDNIELFSNNFILSDKPMLADHKEIITFSNKKIKLNIYKSPFFFEILNENGDVLLQEAFKDFNTGQKRLSELARIDENDGRIVKITDSFSAYPDEQFYGFGEKFSPIGKRGYNIELWNRDAIGNSTDFSYKSIPFFLSSRGYGLYLNTLGRLKFSLCSSSFNSYTVEAQSGQLDYYFFYGPSFKKVIGNYMKLTGLAENIPPKWSFGLWLSKYGYRDRGEVEEIIRQMREKDVSFDVIHLDPYWLRKGCYCDLVWDEKKWPKPSEMIAGWKEQGVNLSVWVMPMVSCESEMYLDGEKNNYFLKNSSGKPYLVCSGIGEEPETDGLWNVEELERDKKIKPMPLGAYIDFTNPDAVDWWSEKLENVLKSGVRLFMLDVSEIIPEDAIYFNGRSGLEMHNLYPSLYQEVVYSCMKKSSADRPIMTCRSGYAGTQRTAISFSGDPWSSFESMRNNLRGGLSSSLSGIQFWTHDIGGFTPKASTRLFARWTQIGFFSSHSRLHGQHPKEPWTYGEEAEKIFRFYNKLRYSLIPYIYSCAYKCLAENTPFIKPLVLEYQSDKNAALIDDEYIFGEDFLVAPIFNEKDFREVYLPKGIWVDYWSKKEFVGGEYINYVAAIDKLPLFIKKGAIVPMQDAMSFIKDEPLEKILIEIYPDKESDFLYKDDFEEIKIGYSNTKECFNINISNLRKKYEIKLFNIDKKPLFINNKEADIKKYSYDDLNKRMLISL